jgi:hypothetical protein
LEWQLSHSSVKTSILKGSWTVLLQGIFWNLTLNQLKSTWYFKRAAMLIRCVRLYWNLAINKLESSYIVLLSSTKMIYDMLEEALIFQFKFKMAAKPFLSKFFTENITLNQIFIWNLNPLQIKLTLKWMEMNIFT